jgi:D-alanine-D-alanine ligase
MSQQKMAILFGGQSPEHEISILSFKGIFPSIARTWEILPVYISREGSWFLQKNSKDIFKGKLDVKTPFDIRQTRVDFVFIALHGENGEDGRMQGYLDMLGIPYSGCGAEASTICMNKILTKQVCKLSEISVTPWVNLTQGDHFDPKSVSFPMPWVIKSARMGSSFGVSKVEKPAEIKNALQEAFKYDSLALIEPYIQGREFECGVVEDSDTRRVIASEPCEIIPGDVLYSYADKYVNDTAKLICPTRLDNDLKLKIQEMAKAAFCAVGGQGFARCDFLMDVKNNIYLSEINTIPGFTPISMFPKMFEVSGLSREKILAKIIKSGQQLKKPLEYDLQETVD